MSEWTSSRQQDITSQLARCDERHHEQKQNYLTYQCKYRQFLDRREDFYRQQLVLQERRCALQQIQEDLERDRKAYMFRQRIHR